MADQPRCIMSEELAKALVEADVIRDTDLNTISRIVIDARSGHVVQIYLERFGDERLLNVAQTLEGVEISGVPAPEEAP